MIVQNQNQEHSSSMRPIRSSNLRDPGSQLTFTTNGPREVSLLELASVNPQLYSPSQLVTFIPFWCYKANQILAQMKLQNEPLTEESIYQLIELCRVGVMLALQSPLNASLPIKTLLGTQEELQVSQGSPQLISSDFPKISKTNFQLVTFIKNVFGLDNVTVLDIISFSLQFALVEFNLQDNDELCSEVEMLTNAQLILPDEIAEQIRFSSVSKNDPIDPSFVPTRPIHFLIVRYLYEELNQVRLQTPIEDESVFYHLIQEFLVVQNENQTKVTNWNQALDSLSMLGDPLTIIATFIYATGQPIDSDFLHQNIETIPLLFIAMLALRHSIQYRGNAFPLEMLQNESTQIPFILMLLPAICEQTEYVHLLETILKMDMLQNITRLFQNGEAPIKSTSELIELSANGDYKSAQQLLYDPTCSSQLEPEKYRIHKLIFMSFQTDLCEIPEDLKMNTELAIILINMKKNNLKIDQDLYSKLFRAAHSELISLTFKLAGNKPSYFYASFVGLTTLFTSMKPQCTDIPSFHQDIMFDDEKYHIDIIEVIVLLASSIAEKPVLSGFEDFLIFPLYSSTFYLQFLLNFDRKIMTDNVNTKTKDYLLKALEDKEESINYIQSYVSQLNKLVIKDTMTTQIAKVLLQIPNFPAFAKFAELYPHITDIIDKLTLEEITPFIKYMISLKDPNTDFFTSLTFINSGYVLPTLYKILGESALLYPIATSLILARIPRSKTCSSIILSNLPSIPEKVPGEFIQFVQDVIQNMPKSRYNNPNEIKLANNRKTTWKEDIIGKDNSSDVEKTIWDWRPACPCTYLLAPKKFVGQPMFFCYTCNLSNSRIVCLECAISCHKNHDLAYIKSSSCYCDCYLTDKCMHRKEGDPVELTDTILKEEQRQKTIREPLGSLGPGAFKSINPQELRHRTDLEGMLAKIHLQQTTQMLTNEPQDVLNADTLSNLFLKFSNTKPIISETKEIPIRFSGDLTTKPLNSVPIKTLKQSFHFQHADIQDSFISYEKYSARLRSERSSLIHMLTSSTIHKLDLAAQADKYILACEGDVIKVYNAETLEKISQFSTNISIVQIIVSDLDPSVFAVCSLKDVAVFTIDQTGKISLTHSIELMLDSISSSIFIVSIHWVPLEPLHLGVVCTSFVKIYDIPIDCISPIACLMCRDSYKITSSVFTVYDGEPYVFVGLSNGKIAFNPCNAGDQETGAVDFSNYSSFSAHNGPAIISYSEKTNIFFISNSTPSLYYCRISSFWEKKTNVKYIKMEGLMLEFVTTHPKNDSLHILKNQTGGFLYMVEFADEFTAVQPLTKKQIPKGFTPSNEKSIMSCFACNDKVYVAMPSGHLDELVPGPPIAGSSMKMPEVIDYMKTDEEEDGSLFNVPPTFWIKSHIETNKIEVKCASRSGLFTNVLNSNNSRFILSGKMIKKQLLFRSLDTKQIIVGFRVNLGTAYQSDNQPVKIKIHNRVYNTEGKINRYYMLPLKKEEVGICQRHPIEFFGHSNTDIYLDNIDVYVVPINDMPSCLIHTPKPAHVDWIKDTLELFVDNNSERYSKPLEILEYTMSVCDAEGTVNDDTLKRLITLMYQNVPLTLMCRRLIMKYGYSKPNFFQIWYDAINDVLNNDTVNKDLIDYLWRDLTLFPDDIQSTKLLPKLWSTYPNTGGVTALVTAFTLE